MEARKMPGSCGAGMWGKTPHLLPSSRMAQTQFCFRPWGMKLTMLDQRNLLDGHRLILAHSGLLTRRCAALGAGQVDIFPRMSL
jgi:hypothetical protein